MSELDQLWVATLTTTLFAAGTNSPIAVIAILTLLGPVIGDVFSNVIMDL